jgi:hypothetical protein
MAGTAVLVRLYMCVWFADGERTIVTGSAVIHDAVM